MIKDVLLLGCIKRFQTKHRLCDNPDIIFEKFINYLILRKYQDSITPISNSFLNVCVGGGCDMGLDGIAILVNDSLVCTKDEIDDVIKKSGRIKIKFLFIQSKAKENIAAAELGSFKDGVLDFLSEQHKLPYNEQIGSWLELKDYLYSDELLEYWDGYPVVICYFAYGGLWSEDDQNFKARIDSLQETATKQLGIDCVEFIPFDKTKIKSATDELENKFRVTLAFVDSMDLNEADNVASSHVINCAAAELIKLIQDDEGELRRGLFRDNVRDYQGETDINSDIFETIRNNPSSFCLYNNGITIVCKRVILANRKVSMENPQVVNGCQTCNVIFKAYKKGILLDQVTVMAKVIATEDYNVANAIVKGTNRQNVVYSEAFETTKPFHKDLEEFILEIQSGKDDSEKILYERRSNQYDFAGSQVKGRIVSLQPLLQTFVSVFEKQPHEGFKYPVMLLPAFKDRVFVDGQSFYPYYISAKLFSRFAEIPKSDYLGNFNCRNHLMLVFSILVTKVIPPEIVCHNSDKIEKYCKEIEIALDDPVFRQRFNETIQRFSDIKEEWRGKMGINHMRGLNSNKGFTDFMLSILNGDSPVIIPCEETRAKRIGIVQTVHRDRKGNLYGFIRQDDGPDIFIHGNNTPHIDFNRLQGKRVVYEITENDPKFGTPRGYVINILPDHPPDGK